MKILNELIKLNSKIEEDLDLDGDESQIQTDKKLVVTAGGFSVYASTDGEQVFLNDKNQVTIAQMSTVIWKQLQQSI